MLQNYLNLMSVAYFKGVFKVKRMPDDETKGKLGFLLGTLMGGVAGLLAGALGTGAALTLTDKNKRNFIKSKLDEMKETKEERLDRMKEKGKEVKTKLQDKIEKINEALEE